MIDKDTTWAELFAKFDGVSIDEFDRDQIIADYESGIPPIQIAMDFDVDLETIERILGFSTEKGESS